MNTLLDTLWYFCYITVELIVLFIAITAIVEIILMYIPQDKISKKNRKGRFLRKCDGRRIRCAHTILRLFHNTDDGRIP